MSEAKKATFSFEKFKIKSFSFNENNSNNDTLSIKFDPSGFYNENDSRYELELSFKAFEGENPENAFVNVTLVAYFKFQDKVSLSEIPPYFYRNAIAIVFPYLRSFVSSLTLQANIKQIILPVLNLSALEQPLKENTKVVQ